jgi:hypothetical protein
MIVCPLEPYASDVRPGDDFQQLQRILMDFFIKLENRKGDELAKEPPSASIQRLTDSMSSESYQEAMKSNSAGIPNSP